MPLAKYINFISQNVRYHPSIETVTDLHMLDAGTRFNHERTLQLPYGLTISAMTMLDGRAWSGRLVFSKTLAPM